MHVEKGAKQVHYEAGPDMTPLVDVVMVLLIFLMMVGKFDAGKKYLISDLPISQSGPGAPPPEGFVPDTPITISVSSTPSRDGYRAFVDQAQASDDDALKAIVAAKLAQLASTGKKKEDVQVFIKPARDLRYSQVVRVYAAALDAGAVKIGFQTAG
jgi:biopolymer transport protein ExbD